MAESRGSMPGAKARRLGIPSPFRSSLASGKYGSSPCSASQRSGIPSESASSPGLISDRVTEVSPSAVTATYRTNVCPESARVGCQETEPVAASIVASSLRGTVPRML